MPKAPRIDSDAELARALGVDRALVSRLKRRGMPTDSVAAAQAWRAANVRARVGGKPARTAASDEYTVMRTRRESAQAAMADIELAKVAATVLDRESTLRALHDKFRELRSDSAGIGERVAPRLAALADEREIRILIDREVATVFEAFARRQLQAREPENHAQGNAS